MEFTLYDDKIIWKIWLRFVDIFKLKLYPYIGQSTLVINLGELEHGIAELFAEDRSPQKIRRA